MKRPLLGRHLAALSLSALALSACRDATIPTEPPMSSGSHPLGLVEVTLTGIGTSQMRGSARVPSPGDRRSGPRLSLSAPATGDGSIQLQALSSGSFTQGTRGAPGAYRYLWATYQVRNAQMDGTAYTTARQNLTFFAAATPSTVNGTAISTLARFDGSAADPGIALGIVPTGKVHEQGGAPVPTDADILQVINESEATAVAAPAGVTALPYGFVVRNAATASRTLPASPSGSQYDGVVTFAFKVPLQSSAAADPFTISAIFLAMDDSETRVTQSLEEQNAAGETAFLARAAAIGATMKTVLPGAASYAGDAATTQTLCAVRTAGPSGGATAELVHRDVASVTLVDPYPGWPLWPGGSVARAFSWRARDGGGAVVADVPVQIGTGGLLVRWASGGLRLVPRRDRATGTVTASACGRGASTPVRVSGYSSIDGGSSHSLAIVSDGTVSAWGSNISGQTTVPPGLSAVVQVTAGLNHSVALKADGTLVAWGNNNAGQGTVPGGLTGVVQVAAGNQHNLALKSDGTVVAWGDNTLGAATVPPGLTNVVQISAGNQHSLALKSDGTVIAWGNNGSGQAVVPPTLTGVVQVVAGALFSLALKSDGTVVAWGNNTFGQGNVPAGLANVVQLAAGAFFALALKSDGTIVGWGDNNNGAVTVPPGLTNVVQVMAGNSHSISLRNDGRVFAWGQNSSGERNVPASLAAAVP